MGLLFVWLIMFEPVVLIGKGIESNVNYINTHVFPPAEVPFGCGFDYQAEQSRQLRKEFFRTHQKINDRWVNKEA